jgi:outer membrane protein TolC
MSTDVDEARAVLEELRRERQAAERALEALRTAKPATPRRAELHRALERPREPKGVLDGYDPETTQKLVYAIAGGLALLLLIVVVLVLL